MIELINFKFKNFRALSNLEIDLSAEGAKLTIVKSNNFSGKTTMLSAIMWCLYGDEAINGIVGEGKKRIDYRMSPLNTPAGSQIDISVECTFRYQNKIYLAKRFCEEIINDKTFIPSKTSLIVFLRTSEGDNEIKNPETLMNQAFPFTLKDLFFYNGDMAEKLIPGEKGSRNESRKKISEGIDSLFDLNIIELSIDKVKNTKRLYEKGISEAGDQGLNFAKEKYDNSLTKQKEEELNLSKLKNDIEPLELEIEQERRTRDDILSRGGNEAHQLKVLIQNDENLIKKNYSDILEASNNLRRVINDFNTLYKIAGIDVFNSLGILEKLKNDGTIPNVKPEILRKIIDTGTCFCGVEVLEGHVAYENILKEINKLNSYNENSEVLSRLYDNIFYAKKIFEKNQNFTDLKLNLNKISASRINLNEIRKRVNENIDKAKKLENLGEALEIVTSRITKLEESKKKKEIEINLSNRNIGLYEKEVKINESNYQRLLKNSKVEKKSKIAVRVCEDIINIYQNTLKSLKQNKLSEVETKTNIYFNAFTNMDVVTEKDIVKSVNKIVFDITNFDVSAVGPQGENLLIKTDLSGFQQRTLSMALQLALINTSGQTLPIVIDTPIGNGTGPAKKAFIKHFLDKSNQTLLFVTQSEISGIEKEIYSKAGKYYTLTNIQQALKPDLYPNSQSSMLCNCDYKTECKICAIREAEGGDYE
jgi:DNA sulfur modification protein DndD